MNAVRERRVTFLRSALALATLLAATVASADDFRIDDAAVSSPLASYKARRIEFSGSKLSRESVQRLLAADDKTGGSDRFAQIDADRISIPELIAETRAQDYAQTVTYRDLILSDVAKGVARRVEIGGAEVDSRRSGSSSKGHLGAMRLEGVDFPALLRLTYAARASADEPKRITTRAFAMAGAQIEIEGGGKVTVGEIGGRDFGGRPLAAPLGGLIEATPKLDATEPSPEARRAIAAMTADLLASMDVGAIEARDLRFVAPGVEQAPGVELQMRRMALEGLADGRIAQLVVEGVASNQPEARFALDRIALSGLDLTASLKAAAAPAGGPAAPRFDRIDIAGVSASGPDGPVSAAGVSIAASDWLAVAPTKLSARIDRLSVSLAGAGAGRNAALAALGYDKVEVSGGLEAKFDPAKGELSVDKIEADSAQVGRVAASLMLSRIPVAAFSGDWEAARSAWPSILFWRTDLAVMDKGLIGRIAQVQAAKAGASETQARARLAQTARALVHSLFAAAPKSDAQVDGLADAVAAVATGAPTLDVRIWAPDGMGLVDFALAAQLGTLSRALKIEAKAR